jgi:hypothetical protein
MPLWQRPSLLREKEYGRDAHKPAGQFMTFNKYLLTSFSENSLLGKLGLVLRVNAKVLDTLQFLLLDSLNLQSVVLELLADALTLFQVVKSVLLLHLSVLGNLGSKNVN